MPKKVKDKEELDALAKGVVDLLCKENLLIWQAKEVLRLAMDFIEWETLNNR